MRKDTRKEKMSRTPVGAESPRTGVGTPGPEAEAGGAALGGDTGDVGTPRDEVGGSRGGMHGTTSQPQGSTVWRHRRESDTLRERRRRIRNEAT